MLLFQKRFHEGLKNGAVRLTFRFWSKPQVKPGGRYRVHPIGVVQVDSIEQVKLNSLNEKDSMLAGFTSKQEMLDYMNPLLLKMESDGREVSLFKVALHYGGDGDRASTALKTTVTKDELVVLKAKLQKMDALNPWTKKTFELIQQYPRIAASQLALKIKMEKVDFKAYVVKLKKLGLTQSFEVGYEISPYGTVVLKALGKK
jgi:hypothetical protein